MITSNCHILIRLKGMITRLKRLLIVKQILLVSALRIVSTDNSIENMLNDVRVQRF